MLTELRRIADVDGVKEFINSGSHLLKANPNQIKLPFSSFLEELRRAGILAPPMVWIPRRDVWNQCHFALLPEIGESLRKAGGRGRGGESSHGWFLRKSEAFRRMGKEGMAGLPIL
nr:hypothetical protein Iba_chr06aCG10510 [Ipomoea batatas]